MNFKSLMLAAGSVVLLSSAALAQSISLAKSQQSSVATQQAQVLNIVDGDTLDAKLPNNKIEKIRMACIDAPERGENPFDKDATNRLKQLTPVGTSISVRATVQGRDRYGRLVSEIYRNGKSINLQMVQEGKAIVQCEYLYNCADSKTSYLNAEKTAKSKGLGIWNPRQMSEKTKGKKPCT